MTEPRIPPRKDRSLIVAGLILLLLLANGVQFWISRQDKKEIEEKDVVIREKVADLSRATLSLDSMRRELDLKIAEIRKLGGDTAGIGLLKRQIERDLKLARRQNLKSRELIEDLKGRIEDYELQLAAKDQEILKLKKENAELYSDNNRLKNSIVQREDSISKLAETKARMSEQLSIAARLRAESIRISIIDNRGREKEDDDYRARKISKLKVAFSIADNKVAQIENKEVFMRIMDPEGGYLYDIGSGGGTFLLDGRESPYTSKLSFLFDNKQAQLSFIWEKGSQFKTGTYTVELFCEGAKMGQANFIVR
jgi:hypothetical protein